MVYALLNDLTKDLIIKHYYGAWIIYDLLVKVTIGISYVRIEE
jgi:hypothetical protein